MMTLTGDPPTLNREACKHKYSRSFKDMIDSCLQKAPSKRSSSEKLLQHAFFKQARSKEDLIELIDELPSASERSVTKNAPHLKVKKSEEELGVSWDFSVSDDEADPNKLSGNISKMKLSHARSLSVPTTPVTDRARDRFFPFQAPTQGQPVRRGRFEITPVNEAHEAEAEIVQTEKPVSRVRFASKAAISGKIE
jgi:serine/threonine protein kinase